MTWLNNRKNMQKFDYLVIVCLEQNSILDCSRLDFHFGYC